MSKRTARNERNAAATGEGSPRSTASKLSLIIAALGGFVVGGGVVAWEGHSAPAPDSKTNSSTPAATGASEGTLPSTISPDDRKAIDELVKRYFATWSAKDIVGYGRCFHPNARIWYSSGSSLALAPFLDTQAQAHQQSPVPLTEDPLGWEVTGNNGLGHVRIHWELHRGPQNVRGYDFFTLVKAEGRWQIMAIIFNEE